MRNFQPRQNQQQIEIWNTQLPIENTWGIYARQSTPGQLIKNTQSTEMQTDDLLNWLLDKGVKEHHIHLFDADLGVSGTLRIDQRTGLQELVERIQADAIKAVLVYQVSRLFRDDTGIQYNTYADICKKHNCLLVTSDSMVFNFNNPMHLKMFRYLGEMAAEYINQQIKGVLHAARIRLARQGKYAGMGSIPTGYIVDYDKHSPTYRMYLPYEPHARIIRFLFERYFALMGNLHELCKELYEMPVLFPPFGHEVDSRVIARVTRRKVAGGYHISRSGLVSTLTNPFYIGWCIVQGDIISRNNHEPIVEEDVFWYAFNRLSAYTTEGKPNMHTKQSRRFYQRGTSPHGILKDRISSSIGSVFVHKKGGSRWHYNIVPATKEHPSLILSGHLEIDIQTIDEPFLGCLFTHLRQTHDFDEYRRFLTLETEKQVNNTKAIDNQLVQIDIQQETILTNLSEITEPILVQRLNERFTKLETTKAELLQKRKHLQESDSLITLKQLADFQTELEQVIVLWDSKPFYVRKEFTNLLVKEALIDLVSTHWLQLDITWTHPAWGIETLYIHRTRGSSSPWTQREKECIEEHFPSMERETLLQLLPDKSWLGIKMEAGRLGVKRTIVTSSSIPQTTTWSDYLFMQEQGISFDDQRTICNARPALEEYL